MNVSRTHFNTGFTLVELMIIVTIVGVLGALATYGVRNYIQQSKTSETFAVINAIRAAEEAYFQDTFQYLDVSQGDFNKLHPSTTPGAFKRNWAGDGDTPAVSSNFRELGVQVDGPVYFSYGVVAGRAGAAWPAPPTARRDFNFPEASPDPFYIVLAKGDVDGDGRFIYVLTHSLTNELYIEDEGK